jgi:hypothetical protein
LATVTGQQAFFGTSKIAKIALVAKQVMDGKAETNVFTASIDVNTVFMVTDPTTMSARLVMIACHTSQWEAISYAQERVHRVTQAVLQHVAQQVIEHHQER